MHVELSTFLVFTKAVVAQLVERQPSKLNVASSNLVRRSNTLTHTPAYKCLRFYHKHARYAVVAQG